MFGPHNTARNILAIPEHVLAAKLAAAKKDWPAAIAALQAGVKAEDSLNYIEPADWYIPVRDALGAAHLAKGHPAEAERVFRAELEKHPRSGRALFGLWKSLEAQKKNYDARFVEQQFRAAWKGADTELRIEEF